MKKTIAPSKLPMIIHSKALSEIKDLIENSYNYRTKTMMMMMMVIMMVTTTTMIMIEIMIMMVKILLIKKPHLKLFSQSKTLFDANTQCFLKKYIKIIFVFVNTKVVVGFCITVNSLYN